MKIKNLLVVIFLVISVLTTPQNSYAQWAVFDGVNLRQAIVDYGLKAKDFAANIYQGALQQSIVTKEYGLDSIAGKLGKQALKKMQKETIKWASTGFKGRPTFLANPQQFFSNIAVTELRGVTSQLTNNLRYANREIAAELINSTRDQLSVNLTPTIDLTVRNNICSQTKIEFLAKREEMAENSPEEYEAKKAYIDQMCSGPITEEKYQALKKCFKNDFYCGGWAAFNAALDPRNDDNYRLQKAKEALYVNRTSEEQRIKENIQAGNGFLSIETCPDEEYRDQERKEGCKRPVYTTPGKIISDAVGSVVTSPGRQGENIDEINEFLDEAVTGFINNLANQGLNLAANALDSVADSADDALNDLQNDIDRNLSDVVTQYNTTNYNLPPAPTGQPQTQPGDLSNADRQRVVAPMIQTMQTTLDGHNKGAAQIEKELAFYQNFVGYLNQIPQCYASKRAQEEVYIANGQKPAPAVIVIPSDVNQYLNTRLAESQNKLSSITAESNQSIQNRKDLIAAIEFLKGARNAAQIQNVYEIYSRNSAAGKYLNEGTAAAREAETRQLFEDLTKEKEDVAAKYLQACQNIDPRTEGTRFDFTN
jgi:hypothetical protein